MSAQDKHAFCKIWFKLLDFFLGYEGRKKYKALWFHTFKKWFCKKNAFKSMHAFLMYCLNIKAAKFFLKTGSFVPGAPAVSWLGVGKTQELPPKRAVLCHPPTFSADGGSERAFPGGGRIQECHRMMSLT